MMPSRIYDSGYEAKYVFDKHLNFIRDGPLKDKLVRVLPGIEETLGERLVDAGFPYAYQLLGQYLLFKKNKNYFMYWMSEICGANPRESSDCYYALEAWADNYM